MSATAFANVVLIVHFLFVLFVVGGLMLVWAGAAAGWRWIRNRRLRQVHLAAVLFAAFEAVAGIACPLTVWEDALRRAGTSGESFVARWVSSLLYYALPEWVFTLTYIAFASLVALTWRRIPPNPPRMTD